MWPMVGLSTSNQSSLVLEDKNRVLSTFIADLTHAKVARSPCQERGELQVAKPAAANLLIVIVGIIEPLNLDSKYELNFMIAPARVYSCPADELCT
jgi:hypothetical protein